LVEPLTSPRSFALWVPWRAIGQDQAHIFVDGVIIGLDSEDLLSGRVTFSACILALDMFLTVNSMILLLE
jgi:hypothetical protein